MRSPLSSALYSFGVILGVLGVLIIVIFAYFILCNGEGEDTLARFTLLLLSGILCFELSQIMWGFGMFCIPLKG